MIIVSEIDNSFINQVIKWLKFYNYNDWIRINKNSSIDEFIYLLGNNFDQLVFYSHENEGYISISNQNIFSYRGVFNIKNAIDLPYFQKQVYNLSQSLNKIINSNTNSIAGLSEQFNLKLYNLFLAKKFGLKIPDTYVGSPEKLKEVFDKQKTTKFITKSITNIFKFDINNKGYFLGPGTVMIENNDFKRDEIFPSLIQNTIEKEFDIRSVYFEGIFYSLAIFSPKQCDTVDFRDLYATTIPRNVPFNLPEEIKTKLRLMANELNFKFCSFDLIYSSNNEYVFIEVNPEGIVDWVSLYGNFNLARIISKNLIENEKREN